MFPSKNTNEWESELLGEWERAREKKESFFIKLGWYYHGLGKNQELFQKNQSISQALKAFLGNDPFKGLPSQWSLSQVRLIGPFGQAPTSAPIWLLLHRCLPAPNNAVLPDNMVLEGRTMIWSPGVFEAVASWWNKQAQCPITFGPSLISRYHGNRVTLKYSLRIHFFQFVQCTHFMITLVPWDTLILYT